MDDSFPSLFRWFLLGIGVAVIAAVYWVSRRGSGRSPAADPTVNERTPPPGFPRDDEPQPATPALSDAPGDSFGDGAGEAPAPGRQIQQWAKQWTKQWDGRHAEERDEQEAGKSPDDERPEKKSGEKSGQKLGQKSGGSRIEPQLGRQATETAGDDIRPEAGCGDQGDNLGDDQGDNLAGGRLLVLHVQAKPDRKFAGPDVLRVAEQVALERTEGGFFQRRAPDDEPTSDEPPLFYMANMFSPGVFEWDKMASFSTSGLSLFAQLPGALSPPETFDELLKCARLFAAKLHGAVLDESRSDLTAQTVQHIKEDLQTYARSLASPNTGR